MVLLRFKGLGVPLEELGPENLKVPTFAKFVCCQI
jgi:hypothetical protein